MNSDSPAVTSVTVKAPPLWAVLGLVGACFFWGIGFPITKAFALRAHLVAPGASDWFIVATLVAGRFLLAGLILLALERARPTRLELEQGIWVGLFSGIGLLFQTDGMARTDASTSAFLTQGYVVVLPVVAAVAAKRWPELRVVLAVLGIVLGLAVLARFDPRTFHLGRGEWETLVAAFFFGLQILSLGRAKYRGNRSGPVSVVFFFVNALCALPLALATYSGEALSQLVTSRETLMLFGLLVVLGTLCPFLLMNRNQPHVPPAEAGIIYGAEPLFGSAFALFLPALLTPLAGTSYPNELLTPRLLLGGALVTLANVVLQLRGPRSSA
jgi:drug/metabolite transporter (DMT)-like permease